MESQNVIAERILGRPIDWKSADTGFLECPGKDLHSTATGKKDCRIKLNGSPTLYCFHNTCSDVLASLNRELRRAMPSGSFRMQIYRPAQPRGPTRGQRLAEAAAKQLPAILKEFSGPLEDSPTALTGDVHQDAVLFLELFEPDDVIWIGNVTDSANDTKDESEIKRCRLHFVTAAQWKRRLTCAWQDEYQSICPNAFKPRSYSRSNGNVAAHRFLVVESDVLSKHDVTAVFKWLRQEMRLRAIIDTAGKSLHGWFSYPDNAKLAELRVILPALKCDRQLLAPAHPVRRPGGLRGQRYQTLLWLDLSI